ncbi:replication endonuclease [Vibrio coralliilyticus]|uniref:replication endonuclease n=1 Tax=Vibrio coralliilyticus TaxID=190893 RepID=UPI0017EB3771|nr:replication endonuclease [Vibrio coralliilyticus]NUW69563.1 replication endonuclease [Vibrio coralliilyticus]
MHYHQFHEHGVSLSLGQVISNLCAHLPQVARADIDYKVGRRKRRAGATDRNVCQFAADRVRDANAVVHHITRPYPFAKPEQEQKKQAFLTHDTLMSDERMKALAFKLTGMVQEFAKEMTIDEDSFTGYLSALVMTYDRICALMRECFIQPPEADMAKLGEKITQDDAIMILECAIRRCLNPKYLIAKFRRLRQHYLEHAQITLGNVGNHTNQHRYVSRLTLSRFKQQQRDAEAFLKNMVAINHETEEEYNLKDVADRTTANPKNRRTELVVRVRGDEERALDMGFIGLFITWTLPSKYHRNSHKWNGCTVKDAHQNLMKQWERARARFAKDKIPCFGLRVAEPHKDGTPHLHAFVYCPEQRATDLLRICAEIARSEDAHELTTKDVRKRRFHAKKARKGKAVGYIIKYISKNINGSYLSKDETGKQREEPTTEDADNALSVRAWASTWRIKQFAQFGSPPVGIWRQLRRASPIDVAFDEQLAKLRDHCDNSRWKGFCQAIDIARLAYEVQLNQYGENTPRTIGIEWKGKVVETCRERYVIVKKSEVKAWKEKRRFSPWSTDNKYNRPPPDAKKAPPSGLEQALMDATGWTQKGVQCLLKPLSLGATVPIDKHVALNLCDDQVLRVLTA